MKVIKLLICIMLCCQFVEASFKDDVDKEISQEVIDSYLQTENWKEFKCEYFKARFTYVYKCKSCRESIFYICNSELINGDMYTPYDKNGEDLSGTYPICYNCGLPFKIAMEIEDYEKFGNRGYLVRHGRKT